MNAAAATPVLAYERPLMPGSVRISHFGDGVSVTIAPDGARHTLFNLVLPIAGVALVVAIPSVAILASGGWWPGLAFVAVLVSLGVGGICREYRRRNAPIVFTADPRSLHARDPMDDPPDETLGVFEIASVDLRRLKMLGFPYQLSVRTLNLPGRPADRHVVLLTSPSFETLDRIGRVLVEAMGLAAPVANEYGWSAGRP